MLRFVMAAVISVSLAACSVGSSSGRVPLALTESGSTGSLAAPKRLGRDVAPKVAAAEPSTRTAALDKAPPGSFEKAPSGALADRDYSRTQLDADKALALINAYRREHGLKTLKLNSELTLAAKRHATDLARWDRISHYGSDGSNPWDRIKRTSYSARVAAENVGTGQGTFEEVMKGWRESPSHDKNLKLPDAEHVGIALVHDPKTEFRTFWTLVLASPL